MVATNLVMWKIMNLSLSANIMTNFSWSDLPRKWDFTVHKNLLHSVSCLGHWNVTWDWSSTDFWSQKQTLFLYEIPLKQTSKTASGKMSKHALVNTFLYLQFLKLAKYAGRVKGEGISCLQNIDVLKVCTRPMLFWTFRSNNLCFINSLAGENPRVSKHSIDKKLSFTESYHCYTKVIAVY